MIALAFPKEASAKIAFEAQIRNSGQICPNVKNTIPCCRLIQLSKSMATDSALRSVFQNDSVMGRHMDGDDDLDETTSTLDSDSTLFSYEDSNTTGGGGGINSTSAYNTGPKGVRSDARAYSRAQNENQKMANPVYGATTWSQDQAEEDARGRWVEARLKELSKKTPHGTFVRVDAAGYLSLIESQPRVAVLIVSGEDEVEEEEEEVLELLPSAVHAYDALTWCMLGCADAEMDQIACPAILVYQDGELVVNCVRVQDEVVSKDGEMSRRTVESALLRLGVLRHQDRLDGGPRKQDNR